MARKRHAIITAALLVALLGSSAAWGQAFGRVVVRVVDTEGNPIPEAQLTVTCEELPAFLIETKTKKKGQTTIAFADATKFYKMKVEKEGFTATEVIVKAEIRNTIEQEVVLRIRGEEVQMPSGETQLRRFTPAEKLFNAGVELLQSGDMAGAKAKFMESLATDADLAAAHSALAAVHLEQKSYSEAIASANRFLELSPDHPSGFRVLYEAHRGLGQEAEAEAALAKLSELGDSGDNAVLLYNEGVEALRIGKNDTAKGHFEAALEADPNLAPAMVAIGRILLAEGDLAAAAARAEEALAIDPTNYTGHLVRYESYSGLGEAEKADEAFTGLSAADPQRVGRLFYDKGIEYFNAGNSTAAISSFERSLEADETLVRAHYHLGLAYVNAGRSAKAKEHLQQFLDAAPDDADAGTASEMLKYLGN